MRILIPLLVVLAGCTAPPSGLLEGECQHGICAPEEDARRDWSPLFATDFRTDPAFEASSPSFVAADGAVAFLDHSAAALKIVSTDPLVVQNVSIPADAWLDAEWALAGADGTWFVLEPVLADWDPEESADLLIAVDAGTGQVHNLSLPRVYVVDVRDGHIAVAWMDGDDEVVGTWAPGNGPTELWRHGAQLDRVVGRLTDGGLLLVEHAEVTAGGTSWERTVHHVGAATWSMDLGRGIGVVDVAPVGQGVLVYEHSEAYHFRHHHNGGHASSFVARHDPDGLQWRSQQGDPAWRLQEVGGDWWLTGAGGGHPVQEEPVGPAATSLALQIDAVDGSLYWLADGHLWRASPGSPPLQH